MEGTIRTLVLLDNVNSLGVDLFLLAVVKEEASLGLASAESGLDHVLHHLGLGSAHPLPKGSHQRGLDVVSNINTNL